MTDKGKIGAHVGSFVMPLGGMVAASVLMSRREPRLARTVYLASLLGALAYVIVFIVVL